jgi:hypothetical protein
MPIRLPTMRGAVHLGGGNYLATYGVTANMPGGEISLAYMQLITPDGFELWGEDGMPVSFPCDSIQSQVHAIEDGAGGAFIVWWDDRLSIGYYEWTDLYGQHISPQGELLWEIEGRHLTTAVYEMGGAWKACADNAGGFLAVWMDGPWGVDVYGQHFDGEGQRLWPRNILVAKHSTPSYGLNYPRVAPHPDGGCFVTWADYATTYEWVWGQRLSPNGRHLWPRQGINFNMSEGFGESEIIPDGRAGIFFHNPAQVARINENGQILWVQDINENTMETDVRQFAVNPFNRLLYIIYSKPNPPPIGPDDVFGQALDYDGNFRWPRIGRPVIIEPTADQMQPRFCFRSNGMVIFCMDERNYSQTYFDMYFQITDSLWRPLLDPAGAPFIIRADQDLTPTPYGQSLISDSADGAIGFNRMYQDSSFANHILADGSLGYPLPRPVEALPLGQIQGFSPEGIRFHLNEGADMRLEIYDLLGRKVQTLMEGYLPAGDHQSPVPVAGLSSGFYIVRLSAEGWRTTAKTMVIK